MRIFLTLIALMFIGTSRLNAHNYAYDLSDTGLCYLKTSNPPLTGNASFTIEFWFNNQNNTYNNYARLLAFTSFGFDIGLNTGTLVVYDGSWRTTSANNLNNGWHHVAVTNNTSNMYVYVDGSQVYTKASATFNFSNKIMLIGTSTGENKYDKTRAVFDEVRVWNTARTLVQINGARSTQLVGNESNLVAYYKMNNLNDASASSNHLTLVGNGKQTSVKFGTYLKDYALSFDVYDDACQLAANTITGNGNFTIEMQFKTANSGNNSYNRLIGWDNFQLEVALGPNGVLSIYQGSWVETYATGLNDGNWHHLAITRNAQYLIVYIDNAILPAMNTNLNLTGKTYIGGNPSAANPVNISFDGQIDEIRIWNILRTQTDLTRFRDSTLVGNEIGLLSYFDLNTTTNSIINLVSGAANMTRVGPSGVNNLPQYIIAIPKLLPPSILYATNGERCGLGKVYLNAASNNSQATIQWYSAKTGGAPFATGNTIQTPDLNSSVTFYVDASLNGFKTPFRTPVEAKVFAKPIVSGQAFKSFICEGETVELIGMGANTYDIFPSQLVFTSGGKYYSKPSETTIYTIIGTVTQTGCKDTSSFTVNVYPKLDVSIQKVKNVLTVAQPDATYQWINCDNNMALANETNRVFTATSPGNYKVIATKNDCSDTSDCIQVDLNNSLNTVNPSLQIEMYPNPGLSQFTIKNLVPDGQTILIWNSKGQLVYKGQLKELTIDVSFLNAGVYVVEIENYNKAIFVKY